MKVQEAEESFYVIPCRRFSPIKMGTIDSFKNIFKMYGFLKKRIFPILETNIEVW